MLVFASVPVYVTSSLTSPLAFYVCSMWAASAGTHVLGWRSVAIVTAQVAVVSALGILEYVGAIPHMPFFENGNDTGLYRNATFVTAMPFVLFAHTIMIFLGASYLSKRLAAREVELTAQKQEQWALLGQFSGAMAHAVKNSLAAIKGFGFLLEKDPSIAEPRRRVAGSIVRETEQLNATVTRYLSLTKSDPLALQEVSLNQAVQRAMAMFESVAHEEGASIVASLGQGLPAVSGDPERLHELLLNLLQNAREAAGSGGRILVETRLGKNGFVEIEVADSGPGIPHHVLPRLFSPFFTTKPRGSGLGLAIVRRIVEAHGGSIVAANRPGGGASFALQLRVAAP